MTSDPETSRAVGWQHRQLAAAKPRAQRSTAVVHVCACVQWQVAHGVSRGGALLGSGLRWGAQLAGRGLQAGAHLATQVSEFTIFFLGHGKHRGRCAATMMPPVPVTSAAPWFVRGVWAAAGFFTCV